MKTLLMTLFVAVLMLALNNQSQAQTFLMLNNTVSHTITQPVAALSVDHELMYGILLNIDNDIVAHFVPSVSLEYNYLPVAGQTYSTGLLNANLTYLIDPSAQKISPYVGCSYSAVRTLSAIEGVCYPKTGTGWTLMAGISFILNEHAAMIMQYKFFDYSVKDGNLNDLGRSSLQTGLSYSF